MQLALFYNKAGCVELNRAAAIHSFKRTGLEEKKGVKSKMAKDKMYGKTLRKNFARHEEIVEMPNLLALQKKSYQWFLDTGLREVFSDVASISNYAGNLELSFIDYKMDEAPKYDVLECKARDATYAAPLKVSVRLYNKETGEIKEQEIFMGDFPLMTESGTFVINGAERVVVSQLVRSPGIYYGKEIDLKTDLPLLTSTVIPYRGAWLEYETDANEMFWVRIDKNRKLPITELIRAIGFKTDAEILELFGDDDRVAVTLEKDACKTYEEAMLEIYRKLRPGEPPTVESATSQIDMLFFDPRRYDLSRFGRYKMNKKLSLARRIMDHVAAENVVDPFTGEILVEADKKIDRKLAEQIDAAGVNLVVLKIDDPMKDQPHKVKVITNGCVDAQAIIDSYYPAFKGVDVKECGINERCCLKELRKILDNASSAEEMGSLQSQSNRYTPTSLDELMPQAKPSELLVAIGLKADARMQVFDDKQFAAYATWFTEENLELFKAMQKSALISGFSRYLSQELAEKFGYETGAPEEAANEAVQSFLSEELGQLYVERYFPAESKAEVEKMVRMMIEAFKTRISRLDWMEESTKQEAMKKLDNITVLIGYPDQWDFNNADIKSVADGGSYFANVSASEADKWQKAVQGLDEPVNPRRFPMAAFTVNAAASRNTNTLIFPAGILQAPFYDKNASFEANLGAIGSTIAHEITHMFDDGGAQYDATGTVRNWWADSDYTHFQTLCKKAEHFYDGYEAAPGIPANGKETLSENISDIGGVACGLEVLSTMENPDYDAFFRSFARQWLRAGSYETLAGLAQSDVHAPNILRTNRVLSNFQEFFDTYGIQPGDGMYVAPEDRIVIW